MQVDNFIGDRRAGLDHDGGQRRMAALRFELGKESGGDPFEAIELVMSWHAFTKSVTEAEQLAQPEAFDFLHLVGDHFSTLRRYVPEFLDILKLRAALAAKDVLGAIDTIRTMNLNGARKVPADAHQEALGAPGAGQERHRSSVL